LDKTIFFFIFLSNIFLIQAQQDKNFSYLPKNKDSLETYITKITNGKISSFASTHHKEIKEILQERKTEFLKEIKDSTYIFDETINKSVKKILTEIYRSNPQIDHSNFYFFIDTSPIPNASCYGNGIFTINLGLFNLLASDDELAFVLSHEIGHYVLKHSDKSLLSHIETLNSKDVKTKIRKIKRQEYGTRKAYAELMKNLNYNFLNRSRKDETQADSLGLAIFSKTKFNKKASISAIAKLDFVDHMVFNEDTKIKNHFNFENYPFKEGWLTRDETLFDIKERANDYALDKDSIKTHPDIPLRVEFLKKGTKDATATTESTSEIEQIKKIANKNSIAVFLDNSNIDLALYQTLVLYNKNLIDEKTYCNIISMLLQKTYESKSNHTFGKYVGSISPFSEEKYLNEVRIFLNNIEIKNVRKIGYSFCEKHRELMNDEPQFSKTAEFFKKLNNQ